VSSTAKSASARVAQLLNLRNVVRNLPKLQEALSGCQSQLLRIIHDVCVHLITENIDFERLSQLISDERLSTIEGVVCNNLNEECTPAKVLLSPIAPLSTRFDTTFHRAE
jgi:DNA mismatch repair protein MSH4